MGVGGEGRRQSQIVLTVFGKYEKALPLPLRGLPEARELVQRPLFQGFQRVDVVQVFNQPMRERERKQQSNKKKNKSESASVKKKTSAQSRTQGRWELVKGLLLELEELIDRVGHGPQLVEAHQLSRQL